MLTMDICSTKKKLGKDGEDAPGNRARSVGGTARKPDQGGAIGMNPPDICLGPRTRAGPRLGR